MKQGDSLLKDTFIYGGILGAVLIVYSLILYIMNLTFEDWAGWIAIPITLGVTYWGTAQYRDKFLNGIISYGKSWQVGTVINIYAGILTAIFTAVLYIVIDPDLINQLYTLTEEKMLADPKITDEQIDMAMKIIKKTSKAELMPLYGLLASILGGMVWSLLSSIFTQKKENPMY